MTSDIKRLYQHFTVTPTVENHVLLAQPVYNRMTGTPITAKLRHVNSLDNNQIGVYLPIPHTCKVLRMGDTDRMLTTMGHELGHSYHRTFFHNVWEETQTEVFELWYTRTLEEMLDRPFSRFIGEKSPLYNHIDYLFTLNSDELKVLHDSFDRTVSHLELEIRRPLSYKLGF